MSDPPTRSDPTDVPVTLPEPVSIAARVNRKPATGRAINALLGVAVAVAIGGVAFAIGRATAPVAAAGPGGFGPGGFGGGNGFPGASFEPGASGFPGGQGGLGGRGGQSVTGTVESVDGDSITVTTAAGTITISIDRTTTYHQATAATAGAVTPGATVTIRLGAGDFGGGGPSASGEPPALVATDVTVDQ